MMTQPSIDHVKRANITSFCMRLCYQAWPNMCRHNFTHLCLLSSRKKELHDAVLSLGEPRDAAVNFDVSNFTTVLSGFSATKRLSCWSLSAVSITTVIIIHRQRGLIVVLNRTRKYSCENSHVCYCSLLDSRGVQSGAINAQCNLGQSGATLNAHQLR